MAIASPGEPFDLEAKSREDDAWRPCRASLSLGIVQSFLYLEFESCEEKARISTRENTISCLRFRSIPIRDGNCSDILEGENVLVMDNDHTRDLYFDAVIEKTHRLRHSSRMPCRCTFEVKWLTGKFKGLTMRVPSNSIMRLSDKHISTHPIVAAFLNFFEPLDSNKCPSLIRILEEAECETNLDGQLYKQVEELSKLAEGYCLSKDVFLGGQTASTSLLHEPCKLELPLLKSVGLELPQNGASKHQNGCSLDMQGIVASSNGSAITNALWEYAQVPNNGLFKDEEKFSVVTSRKDAENLEHEDSRGSRISQEKPTGSCKEAQSMKLDGVVKENSANLTTDKKLDGHRISSRITRSAAKKQEVTMATGNDISTKSVCTGWQSTREKADIKHKYQEEDRRKEKNINIFEKKATKKSRSNFATDEGTQVTGKMKKTTEESRIHPNEGVSSENASSMPTKNTATLSERLLPRRSPRFQFVPRTRSQKKI